MKKWKRGLTLAMVVAGYVAVSFLIIFFVSKSGVYPSGTDTMCHVYKGDVLYQQICKGNWYPLYDSMWYNGVEMMRYWAPLPVYFLAMCQALAGGSALHGYLLFLALIFFLGASAWLVIGCRHGRLWMGAFLGLLWFFMPNNLHAIFAEGNLPRALCMIMLPLFISYVHDYLLQDCWSSLPKMIVCFVLMALCHLGYAGMIALAMLVFLVIYLICYRQKCKVLDIIVAMVLSFLLTGIWAYASFQGGITSTDSSQVMRSFFQDALVSLNPMLRVTEGFTHFYFGLAAFILIVFGMLLSKKESIPGFWTALIIFLCTTSTMYSVLVLLPGSQYLWMLRFISIALCLCFYSFMLWKSLKKPFVMLMAFLLVLDVIPSLELIHGGLKYTAPEDRYETMEEATLIGKAKEITEQRLTLMDESTLGADAAYLISRAEDGVAATFGAGWQSAATAHNIVQLNQAIEDGRYLYLFDRCIELGSDTVVIQVSQLHKGEEDIPEVDLAAAASGYELVDKSGTYRLYHRDTPETFGVITEYSTIGIGTSAASMSLFFPSMEETADTNLNHYSYEELSEYHTVYLAGFTYSDKESAEDMLVRLSESGVKVVILADGIPVDQKSGMQSFLGVDCQNINFSNGYPELDTKEGVLHCDLFPEGYTDWKTVYMNGLDDVWGTTTDLNQELAIYGTEQNDHLIFIGLNLTYQYALTQDASVGQLLSDAFGLQSTDLPQRTIVPLKVTYDKRSIKVVSEYDDVNTTIAMHDIFTSDQKLESRNHLMYVQKGTTEVTMSYPYLKEGIAVSGVALVLCVVFLWFTHRRWKKRNTSKNG